MEVTLRRECEEWGWGWGWGGAGREDTAQTILPMRTDGGQRDLEEGGEGGGGGEKRHSTDHSPDESRLKLA